MARQASTKVVSNPDQIGLGLPPPRRIPLEFTVADVRGLASMTDALAFSVRCSGYDSKVVPSLFGFDEGNWSRIVNARDRFFPQDRLNEFMDVMGNEAPLIQLCESRGYDFSSMRKHQTETELKLAASEARNAELELKLAHHEEFMRKVMGK
jgi:hypothetical protein